MRTPFIPGNWRSEAACRGADPDLFFPERGDISGVHAALAVCHSCPVASSCLVEAINTDQDQGIWGGLSGAQRRLYSAVLGRTSVCAQCGEVFHAERVYTACSRPCAVAWRAARQVEYRANRVPA